MSYDGLWPYVFIVVAGWLATDIWRWLGVLFGNRIDERSELLQWVRAVATALVAAVIARLILFPTGALAGSPFALRIAAVLFGAACFFAAGRRQIVGIGASVAFLAAGLALTGI